MCFDFIDPVSVSSNTTNITINETDRIELWCFATGHPQPSISWYRRNDTLNRNRYLTLISKTPGQSGLIITHSSYERDDGIYTCKAFNGVANLINATESINVTVNIQGKLGCTLHCVTICYFLQVLPVLNFPIMFTAFEGDAVTMTVTVSTAHPPVLPDNITWSYWNSASNESVIVEIDEDRVNISEDGRSLQISDVTSEDEGYYQVLIWHPAGYANGTTYLKLEVIEETGKKIKFMIFILESDDTGANFGASVTLTVWLIIAAVTLLIIVISVVVIIAFKRRKKKCEGSRTAMEMQIR